MKRAERRRVLRGGAFDYMLGSCAVRLASGTARSTGSTQPRVSCGGVPIFLNSVIWYL